MNPRKQKKKKKIKNMANDVLAVFVLAPVRRLRLNLDLASRKRPFLLGGMMLVLVGLNVWWATRQRAWCDTEPVFRTMLLNLNRLLDVHGITMFLEAGALLGAVREGRLLKHELDLDVGIFAKDYARTLALKNDFKKEFGYHLYGKDDYCFPKAWHRAYALEWEPYLGDFPCMRLYDENKWFYTDIYCETSVLGEDIDEKHHSMVLPHDWHTTENRNRKLIYSGDYFNMGTARYESDVLPVGSLQMYGRRFAVPKNTEAVLEGYYGPNWRTPVFKGTRKIFCSGKSFPVLVVVVLALSLFLFCVCLDRCVMV
eukprot:m.210851 g.210851  ORF g.210851 m.210851 type:complete len:312 (+) comp22120_c1_seq6:738-1673(+)